MAGKIRRGELVEVVTFKRGGNKRGVYKVKRRGKVLAVLPRFAVVEFARGYRECIWTDQDESNNPVIRRVTS
jgi:hypothetical protein